MEPRALKIMPIGPEIDENGCRIDDKCDQNPTLWHRIENGTTFRANRTTFGGNLGAMGASGEALGTQNGALDVQSDAQNNVVCRMVAYNPDVENRAICINQ